MSSLLLCKHALDEVAGQEPMHCFQSAYKFKGSAAGLSRAERGVFEAFPAAQQSAGFDFLQD